MVMTGLISVDRATPSQRIIDFVLLPGNQKLGGQSGNPR
jgi:hypothetical protein